MGAWGRALACIVMRYIASAFYIQIMLVCAAAPLYSICKIPFMLSSILGNIVLSPLLVVLLACSAMVYIAYISHVYFLLSITTCIFGYITALWCSIIKFFACYKVFTIAFPLHSALFMIGYGILIFCIIKNVFTESKIKKMMLAGVCLMGYLTLCHALCDYGIIPLEGERAFFTLRTDEGSVILCCVSERPSRKAHRYWVYGKLRQHLISHYGRLTIDGFAYIKYNNAVENLMQVMRDAGIITCSTRIYSAQKFIKQNK
jgi:hypothetical protein